MLAGHDTHALHIEQRHTNFANGFGRKPYASRNARKKRNRRRLPQALVINCCFESMLAAALKDASYTGPVTRVHRPDFRRKPAGLHNKFPFGMSQPDNFSAWKRISQAADC